MELEKVVRHFRYARTEAQNAKDVKTENIANGLIALSEELDKDIKVIMKFLSMIAHGVH